MSIALALTAAGGDALLTRQQEEDAKALGMSGAEVDMARSGSSFDFQVSRALALALAPNDEQRERAVRAGLSVHVCAEIEEIAALYKNRSLP
ncbi:hypothetical protein C0075_02810 [Rhizobium sp. KAs_5_22]|nr:hypothetical protein C0075_02810 [Rhizobium sp. KAs_5_22]